jgi:hypothetical protein
MNSRSSEGVRKQELEGFPEPLFDFERDFIGVSETMDGPISSFTFRRKEAALERAVETGRVETDFQDCGPFSDSQQKAIRREVSALRGIRATRVLESGYKTSGFVNGVLDRYPFIQEAHGREPEVLNHEVMEQIKAMLEQQFGRLFETLRSEFSTVDNDNIVEVVERWFDVLGFKEQGWTVRDARDSRTGFVIVPQDAAIDVGRRTKNAKWPAFGGLIIHESSHIQATINAVKAGQKSLALGWLGYEATNEGLAMLKEKSWTGDASNNNVITRDHYRYILAAYATGALDRKKHGTQDCYDFAVNLSTLSRISTKIKKSQEVNLEEVEKLARKQMGEHIYRLFRGMPKGIAMIKDIVYLDGYTKEAKAFNATNDVEGLMEQKMRGKFNDSDQIQIAAVEELYGQQN